MIRFRHFLCLSLLGLVTLAGLGGCGTAHPTLVWSVTGTVWKVAELEGEMVGADKIPTLQLEPNGTQVAAFGGVNRARGTYVLKDDTLKFEPLMSTMMAGEPAQMAVEAQFLRLLATVDHFRIRDQYLILLSGTKVVARAQATPGSTFPGSPAN